MSDEPIEPLTIMSLFSELVGGGIVSVGEFWGLKFWEAVTALDGAMKWQERKKQIIFEAARMSSFYSMLPHTKKNALKKFTDLIEFSWDQKSKPLDKSAIENLFSKIKARDAK